jgi:hypothetical protein
MGANAMTQTDAYKELTGSQLPALQVLIHMGWQKRGLM